MNGRACAALQGADWPKQKPELLDLYDVFVAEPLQYARAGQAA
jgi:hypothetical protein